MTNKYDNTYFMAQISIRNKAILLVEKMQEKFL